MENKIMDTLPGRWYPWSKTIWHVCCRCGLRHLVEMKVAKNGIIWMKWIPERKKKNGK